MQDFWVTVKIGEEAKECIFQGKRCLTFSGSEGKLDFQFYCAKLGLIPILQSLTRGQFAFIRGRVIPENRKHSTFVDVFDVMQMNVETPASSGEFIADPLAQLRDLEI